MVKWLRNLHGNLPQIVFIDPNPKDQQIKIIQLQDCLSMINDDKFQITNFQALLFAYPRELLHPAQPPTEGRKYTLACIYSLYGIYDDAC